MVFVRQVIFLRIRMKRTLDVTEHTPLETLQDDILFEVLLPKLEFQAILLLCFVCNTMNQRVRHVVPKWTQSNMIEYAAMTNSDTLFAWSREWFHPQKYTPIMVTYYGLHRNLAKIHAIFKDPDVMTHYYDFLYKTFDQCAQVQGKKV